MCGNNFEIKMLVFIINFEDIYFFENVHKKSKIEILMFKKYCAYSKKMSHIWDKFVHKFWKKEFSYVNKETEFLYSHVKKLSKKLFQSAHIDFEQIFEKYNFFTMHCSH